MAHNSVSKALFTLTPVKSVLLDASGHFYYIFNQFRSQGCATLPFSSRVYILSHPQEVELEFELKQREENWQFTESQFKDI